MGDHLTRVSYKHTEKLAELAKQRTPAVEPTPLWVHAGAVRAVLGDRANGLIVCSGECGLRLIPYSQWQTVGKAERKRLRELGVNRVSSFGRCWKCAETGKAISHGDRKYRAQKISLELKAQIPQIWKEIQDDGGATKELGERLGVTRERARQLVHELDLPRKDGRVERAEVFLEELHHLVSFGLGVHEIAERLNIPCDSLVRKVDNLRHNGKTTVSFPGYFREEWSDAA